MSVVAVSGVAEPGSQAPGLEAVTRYEPAFLSFPGNDSRPHTVTCDSKSFMIDGQRLSIWSGEFRYWRLSDVSGWRDIFQKMRANGYNSAGHLALPGSRPAPWPARAGAPQALCD